MLRFFTALSCCLGVVFFANSEPRPGVAMLGLSACTEADVNFLATALVTAKGPVEVASLPYSFNREFPFENLNRLVTNVLPRLEGVLYLTVYLEDGANRRTAYHSTHVPFMPNIGKTEFWAQLRGSTTSERKTKAAFLQAWGTEVVQPYHEWASNVLDWASAGGHSQKLQLIVVPVLEDDAPSSGRYEVLLNATAELLEDLPVRFRRNPNGAYDASKRVGVTLDGRSKAIPYELHTNQRSKVLGKLGRNDVVNNDGDFVLYAGERAPSGEVGISLATFRANQQRFLKEEISSLLWRLEFNGVPRSTPPHLRAPLTPLSESQTRRDRLTNTLKSR